MNGFRVGTLAVTAILASASSARCDITTIENFSYPVQSDSTGFFDGFGTTYRVTTTGTYGGVNDLTVVTWSEGFSSGTGILDLGGNQAGFLDTSSQTGLGASSLQFAGITDLPGFGDTAAGGPFGSFFSSPQNLNGSSGSVIVRAASGTNAAQFRLLATDASDNEIATNPFTLGTSFQTFNYVDADFVNLVQGVSFDATQVVNLGIEFFVTADGSGNVDSMRFEVDQVRLTSIPEPGAIVPVVGLLLAILLWQVNRRSRSAGASQTAA